MKYFVMMIFCLSPLVALAVPTTDVFLWAGDYEVTKCVHCPDHRLESTANLKNFPWFRIDAGALDADKKLPCAQTDVWMNFVFNMVSDDGLQEETSVFGVGQCEWGTNETLTTTSDTLTYVRKNPANGPELLIILKYLGDNKFEFYKREVSQSPAWGFPADWEYKVEARRIL